MNEKKVYVIIIILTLTLIIYDHLTSPVLSISSPGQTKESLCTMWSSMQGRITMKKLISIFIILACFVSKSEGSAIERLYLESRLIDKFQTELYENPDDFIIGNPEGDITIVEFFDYNCGYCKRALADLNT